MIVTFISYENVIKFYFSYGLNGCYNIYAIIIPSYIIFDECTVFPDQFSCQVLIYTIVFLSKVQKANSYISTHFYFIWLIENFNINSLRGRSKINISYTINNGYIVRCKYNILIISKLTNYILSNEAICDFIKTIFIQIMFRIFSHVSHKHFHRPPSFFRKKF